MNARLRKVLEEEEEGMPSRYIAFDSITGKKNSAVMKGCDGTTHISHFSGGESRGGRREGWKKRGREDEVPHRTVPPYHSE